MLGFLFKIVLVAGLVAAIGYGLIKYRSGGGDLSLQSAINSVRTADFGSLGGQLSQSLDSLVTHTDHSPVVLGIQITNDSLKTVADTLQGLPPDQLQLIKQSLCQPATPSSSSAR